MDKRRNVAFTPGENKRKLTRSQNFNLNSTPRNIQPLNKLLEIKFTKNNTEKEKEEEKKEDPLMKFWKTKEKENTTIKESFNILQKLSGVTPTFKDDNQSFELQKIPDFKPKNKDKNINKEGLSTYSFKRTKSTEAGIHAKQADFDKKNNQNIYSLDSLIGNMKSKNPKLKTEKSNSVPDFCPLNIEKAKKKNPEGMRKFYRKQVNCIFNSLINRRIKFWV